MSDTWTVAGRTFTSRLIVGTGKYKDFAQNAAAVEASGAEIVTVAVRRVNISDPSQPVLMDFIDPKKITYLPNTAGCFTADDAIRTLRLAREAGGWDLVKLEVLGEARTLYPNMRETLLATEVLAKEGFLPMVYCADDPDRGQATGGGRRGGDHAARRADRVRPRASEPGHDPSDRRRRERAGAGRCRGRHARAMPRWRWNWAAMGC